MTMTAFPPDIGISEYRDTFILRVIRPALSVRLPYYAVGFDRAAGSWCQ